jgi:hypothetical protein
MFMDRSVLRSRSHRVLDQSCTPRIRVARRRWHEGCRRASRNALCLLLGPGRLRHGQGEDAALERRLGLVLVDLEGQRDPPLEAAVVPLAEAAILVVGLRLLLAPDREHAVVDEHLDILLVEPR